MFHKGEIMAVSMKRACSRAVPLAIALALCVLLAGCASSASSSASSSSSSGASSSGSSASSASSSAQGTAFGEQTGTALGVLFENETGAEITALRAVPAAGEGAVVQLMKADDKWPAGGEATLYIEPGPAAGVYNLTFDDGGVERTIHNIDFNRAPKVSILVQDDLAYITTTVDGSVVSTHEEEYAIAHPAAEEPQAGEPEEYYEEPVASYDDYGADAGAGEAPAQGDDNCVTDIILR